MEYSAYQQDIFNFIEHSDKSLLVNAVAGAAKTTTIVKSLDFIPKEKQVLFLAFNKHIVNELKDKITHDNVKISTFHGIGFSIYREFLKFDSDLEVKQYKIQNIIKKNVEEPMLAIIKDFVRDLVSIAKQSGMFLLIRDKWEVWQELIAHYDISLDLPIKTEDDRKHYKKVEAAAISIAIRVLKESNRNMKRIDFNDMIYFPLLRDIVPKTKYDIIFIDEAQDVNLSRIKLIKHFLLPEGRVIAVGDKKQCHPTGTQVYVTGKGNIPIEDLKVGQKVMSFCSLGSNFKGKNSQGRKIENINYRWYKGKLIKLTTSLGSHEVTPNHRCLTRFKKIGTVVYAMQHGDYARIGCCKSKYWGGSGLANRANAEDADAAWILGIFEDDVEAKVYERLWAYKFKLPQVTFIAPRSNGGWSEDKIAAFWTGFGTNVTELEICLAHFGRKLEYPIWKKGKTQSLGKYSFITEACNLISGWFESCTFNKDPHKPIWELVTLSTRYYEGKVWSLKVEPTEGGRRLYVANGIVTHNSIFGFTGAHSNAMELLKETYNTESLPLSICYRCSKKVVEHAKKYVSEIEAWEHSPKGNVTYLGTDYDLNSFFPTDAILCRNNKPIITMAYQFMKSGIGCKVLGREIGQGLIELIKKFKDSKTTGKLKKNLEAYWKTMKEQWKKEEKFTKIAALADKVESILVLIGDMADSTSLYKLMEIIEEMFNDNKNGVITLSTIHKAKGVEWPRVFFLEQGLIPSKYAKLPWQLQQERNLRYVAITRAQEELIYINSKGRDI